MPTTPPSSSPDRTEAAVQGRGASVAADQRAAESADEREFDAFAQHQDPLDIVAATWVTRRRSGLGPEGEAELQAWLDADPRNAQAFDDMDATFGEVQQLPDDDVAQLRAGLPDQDAARHATPAGTAQPQAQRPKQEPPLTGWDTALSGLNGLLGLIRPLLPQAAAAAIAFAMVGGGWMGWSHWQRQPVFEQAYTTERGQQLKATLPDAAPQTAERDAALGSTLQLDTATQTQVRLYRDRREVHLQSGQAMFAVHSDPQRPFHVYAGALRITVVGTRFSVRHTGTGLDAGQTVVAVEEGRVRVEKRRTGANDPDDTEASTNLAASTGAPTDQPVELTAGQTVLADARGHIGPVASLAAHTIAPWRDGRLSFDQTPLAQAIAEFERYGRTGLVVRDPAVAALPVGGSYSLQQWQRFAETLPQVLPVRLVRRGEVTEVVAR
ncbi:MAG: FecR domain-containing protein [Hydrogenophaga sp.]|jgi:transmembrane sensor|nr:FecR domain-containing protein [Hydrogenophaga sp.]